MPNPARTFVNHNVPVEQRPVVDGYISTAKPAPTKRTEGAWVIVPEHSTTVPVGPCKWTSGNGKAMPKQGALCQVAFGEQEMAGSGPRIVWWEGEYEEPGLVVPKSAATAYRKAAQTLINGVWETIKVDTAIEDPEKLFNLASGYYVAPSTGNYLVVGQVEVAATVTELVAAIAVSGTRKIRGVNIHASSGSAGQAVVVAGILHVEASQHIELQGNSQAGESLGELGIESNRLSVTRIGEGPEGKEGKAGAAGAEGPAGKEGKAGEGVPKGGTTGQELVKKSNADFDTEWKTPPSGLPAGGEPKQPLVRAAEAEKGEWSPLINGGAAAKGNLELESTSNAEKGKIRFGLKAALDESKLETGETAPRLGLGTAIPTAFVHAEPSTAGAPANVATTPGTEAINVLKVEGPKGGSTTIATKGVGGLGSGVSITSGPGGEAASATEESSGGAGGSFVFASGVGGKGRVASTAGEGGAGGPFTVNGGAGGEAKTTGGKGATVTFNSGKGGKAATTGGEGGGIEFKAAVGGAGATGGKGGTISFSAGNGGATGGGGGAINVLAGASVGKGVGGSAEIAAGKGGEAEKGGTIVLKTEGTTRVTVTTAGAVELQKGIGVFGHAAPAAQHGEIAEPAETLAGHQAAIKAIREVLKEYGMTA